MPICSALRSSRGKAFFCHLHTFERAHGRPCNRTSNHAPSLWYPDGRLLDTHEKPYLLSIMVSPPSSKPWPKTPWGTPVFIPRSLYWPIEILVTLAYIALCVRLESTARTVYAVITVTHLAFMSVIDYGNNGSSWIKRHLGIHLVVPLSTMYWVDCALNVGAIVFPMVLDGFDSSTKWVTRYILGFSSMPALFIIDYGTENMEKSPEKKE